MTVTYTGEVATCRGFGTFFETITQMAWQYIQIGLVRPSPIFNAILHIQFNLSFIIR